MKFINKAISVMLLLVMMLSLSNVTYAASDYVEVLKDLRLLLNTSEEEMSARLTREVGLTMILKSLGYTQEDADLASNNGYFTDVEGWSKGWAELAYMEGITLGQGDRIFAPEAFMTSKEFVVFQLRALGYNSSEAWTNAEDYAIDAGLVSSVGDLTDDNYTKVEAAEVMYNALSSKMVGSTITLVEMLVDEGVVAKEDAIAHGYVSDEFEVSSVDADNLKVITLYFTASVDEESLSGETVEVYQYEDLMTYDSDYKDGVSANTYALHLVNDRQVDIVLGTHKSQNTELTISIEGLLDGDGNFIKEYESEVTLRDREKPYPISARLINPVYLEIVFSEPLQTKTGTIDYEELQIDGEDFVGTTTLSNDSQTMFIEFSSEFDEGDYTLTVEGISDFAGFECDKATFIITSMDDDEKPYVLSATAPNREQVIVEFNEIIISDEGEITIGDRTYELDDDDDEEYLDIYENVVTITLEDPLKSSAATTGVTASFDDIEDMVGNRVSNETSFTFYAASDSTQPTMEVYVNDENAIIVTFSEEVQEFDSDYFALTEYDEDEDDDVVIGVSGVSEYGTSGRAYKIKLDEPLINAATYDLTVNGVHDISVFRNAMGEEEISLEMYDMLRPEVEAVKYLGDDLLRITFSEPMDEDLLEDPDNFKYYSDADDELYDLDEVEFDITVGEDGDYMDIEIEDLDEDDEIRVGRLRDVAGLILENYNSTYALGSVTEFDEGELEAEYIGNKTIKLTADDHDFATIDDDDFLIRSGSSESETHYVANAYIDEDDASIAYVILSSNLDDDAEASGKTQYLYMNDDATTRDTFNQVLDITYRNPLRVTDAAQPQLDLDDDEADTLIIEFSEVVGASSDDKIIDDIFLYDEDGDLVDLVMGENIELSGGNNTFSYFDTITITDLNGGELYTIEILSHNIKDDNGNRIEGLDETEVTIDE